VSLTLVRIAVAIGLAGSLARGAVAEDATIKVDLAKSGVGHSPADFEFARTGDGDLGRWTVVRDPTAVEGFAIEHVSTDQHEDRFPLAIYQPRSLENVAVSVRFKIASGTMLSAGLALGVRNPGSYYAVSASALEQRVDLLLVMNGKVDRIESGSDVNLEKDRWHSLKVTADDDHFVVALDSKVLFTAYDRTRRKDGRIALWTREDNVTRFDQIEIRPLPNTEWR
jgi:hypothetical protein